MVASCAFSKKKLILLADDHYILAFRIMGDCSRGLLRFRPREKLGKRPLSMTDAGKKKGHSFCFSGQNKQEVPRNIFPLPAIAPVYPILPSSDILAA